MKEFTFNDVPQALAQLLDKVNHLEKLITSQRPQQTPEAPEWMNLKDLQAYLPDHPAQTTVYGWIRANSIPYYKTGKKLSFKRSEIDEWLNATRSKTDAEFEADAMIDKWYADNKVQTVTTASEVEGECHPYFSHFPAFGLPAEVTDCHVMTF